MIGRAGSVNEAAGGGTDKPACLSCAIIDLIPGVVGILCGLRIYSCRTNLRCNTADYTGDARKHLKEGEERPAGLLKG